MRSLTDDCLLFRIESSELIHPLVVLELLAKNEHLTISSVKDYIVAWLRKQQIIIEDDRNAIKENNKAMGELDTIVESLKFKFAEMIYLKTHQNNFQCSDNASHKMLSL